jgi:GDPmannose 4,6-dehydratase
MWMMINQNRPDDYCIATGELHSVRDLLDIAFSTLGLNYNKFIKTNDVYFRPSEDIPLVGNYSKAKKILGWSPNKNFQQMIVDMVNHDVLILKKNNIIK